MTMKMSEGGEKENHKRIGAGLCVLLTSRKSLIKIEKHEIVQECNIN